MMMMMMVFFVVLLFARLRVGSFFFIVSSSSPKVSNPKCFFNLIVLNPLKTFFFSFFVVKMVKMVLKNKWSPPSIKKTRRRGRLSTHHHHRVVVVARRLSRDDGKRRTTTEKKKKRLCLFFPPTAPPSPLPRPLIIIKPSSYVYTYETTSFQSEYLKRAQNRLVDHQVVIGLAMMRSASESADFVSRPPSWRCAVACKQRRGGERATRGECRGRFGASREQKRDERFPEGQKVAAFWGTLVVIVIHRRRRRAER